MFICLELTGKPGIYKLFWNESGRDWTAMVTRNSLNFVNNLCPIALVLLRRTKISCLDKEVTCICLSIKVSMLLSQYSNCDFTLQQRMAGLAVNRSACSTGKIFCLPCGVWKCFFIFQHAVCRLCIALGLTSGPESSPQKGSGLQPK